MSTRPSRQITLARLSLEQRLPLLMGALLLAVIVALAAAAYLEVRRTTARTISERVVNVTGQFRDMFQQSVVQMRAFASAAARDPAFVEFHLAPNARTRARALAALEYTGPQPNVVIGTELRDSAGSVLLTDVPAEYDLARAPMSDVIPRNEPGEAAVPGRFRTLPNVPDTLAYPVAASVPGTSLYLVRWRRLGVSRRTREQITDLVGSNASIFLGNTGAPVWTDLEATVEPPGLDATPSGETRTYVRGPDSTEYIGAAAVVPGAPWTVVVDVPRSEVAIPLNAFLRRIILLAGIALLLSLVMAWFASRRITGPMRALAERTAELDATLKQLRETQDTLVRKERLAMLGQLSSGVGHELRNPLGVMTNAVYYLKAVLATSPAKVQDYLNILQQQITLSEKIVSDLLDFARQKPPQRKPTPLREATEAQVAKLGRTDGVRIEVNVPDDVPPVLADPIQLGQVILNLVTNASQAMDGRGRIDITAESNGRHVHYDVTDSGPGIPAENVERIFEPLFTTKARGIGLGLSVSRTLARANGGDLTVTSVPGQGATFRLTLEKAE